MFLSKKFLRRGSLPLFVAAVLLCLGWLAFRQVQELVARELPRFVQQQLAEALGRAVELGRVHLRWNGSVRIDHFTLARLPDEAEDPLTVRSARLSLSWRDLLLQRRVSVRSLRLDEPRAHLTLDLRAGPEAEVLSAEVLQRLSAAGLREIGVRGGDLRVRALLDDRDPAEFHSGELNGTLALNGESVRYRLSAASSGGHGVELAGLRLDGVASPDGLLLERGAARYATGGLAAAGQYRLEDGSLVLRVDVTDVPLRDLAPALGLEPRAAGDGRLTGALEIRADTGGLRRAYGDLSLGPARFSGAAALSWQAARATLDWHPTHARLSEVRVDAPGARLTGDLRLRYPEGELLAGDFEADGRLEARDAGTVARLARALGIPGAGDAGWSAAGAAVEFAARGELPRFADARLSGAVDLARPRLPLLPDQPPLALERFRAAFERAGEELRVTDALAEASGLRAAGEATLTRAEGGHRFAADLSLAADRLARLRALAPEAALWEWLPEGEAVELELAAHGDLDRLAEADLDGRFALHGAAPRVLDVDLPRGRLAGAFQRDGERLELPEVTFNGEDVHARFSGAVAPLTGEPVARGELTLAAAGLPLPGGLRAEEVSLSAAGSLPFAAPELAELAGRFSAEGARVPKAFGNGEWVPGRLAGRFQLREGELDVAELTADAPDLRFAGEARLSDLFGEPRAAARGRLEADAWEALLPGLARVGGLGSQHRLAGGRLTLDLETREAPLARLFASEQLLHGELALTGARFLAEDRPPLEIQELTARLAPDGADWRLESATLRTPLASLSGAGWLRRADGPPRLDLEAEVSTGAAGDLLAALTGSDLLRGGSGGTRLQASVPLGEPARATVSGDLSLRDVGYLRPGDAEPTLLRSLEGRFAREGDRVHLTGVEIELPLYRLAGEGVLHTDVNDSPPVLAARFRVETEHWPELLNAGPLAEIARGGTLALEAEIRRPWTELGADPLAGRFAFTGATLGGELPGGPAVPGLPLDLLEGEFDRADRRVAITGARLAAGGFQATGEGEITGLGNIDERQHRFTLAWRAAEPTGALFALTGVDLTRWHAGGEASGTVTISGAGEALAGETTGRLAVRGGELRGELPERLGIPPALPLRELTASFRARGFEIELPDLHLDAAPLVARGALRLDGAERAAYTGTLSTPAWRAEGEVDWSPGDARFTGSAAGEGWSADGSAQLAGERVSASGQLSGEGWAGDGEGEWAPGTQRLAAVLRTADAGALLERAARDYGYPLPAGRLRGGSGELRLAIHGDPEQPATMRATAELEAGGAVLRLPDEAAGGFAEAELRSLRASAVYANGELQLTEARLRGEPFDLDGSGELRADGHLRLTGEARLTKDASNEVLRQTGWRWLLKLIGVRDIYTEFTLEGPAREPTLDLSITDWWLWRHARKQLSEPVRNIAHGRAPVWSLPAGG